MPDNWISTIYLTDETEIINNEGVKIHDLLSCSQGAGIVVDKEEKPVLWGKLPPQELPHHNGIVGYAPVGADSLYNMAVCHYIPSVGYVVATDIAGSHSNCYITIFSEDWSQTLHTYSSEGEVQGAPRAAWHYNGEIYVLFNAGNYIRVFDMELNAVRQESTNVTASNAFLHNNEVFLWSTTQVVTVIDVVTLEVKREIVTPVPQDARLGVYYNETWWVYSAFREEMYCMTEDLQTILSTMDASTSYGTIYPACGTLVVDSFEMYDDKVDGISATRGISCNLATVNKYIPDMTPPEGSHKRYKIIADMT